MTLQKYGEFKNSATDFDEEMQQMKEGYDGCSPKVFNKWSLKSKMP